MDPRPKCKRKHCKTSTETQENHLHDLGLGRECLDVTPKAWSIKKKK